MSTKSFYHIKYRDTGKYMRAVISYDDNQGFSESITTESIQIKKHPKKSITNTLVRSSSSISLNEEFKNLTLVGKQNVDGKYRSHFGSRYPLGRCARAALFVHRVGSIRVALRLLRNATHLLQK